MPWAPDDRGKMADILSVREKELFKFYSHKNRNNFACGSTVPCMVDP